MKMESLPLEKSKWGVIRMYLALNRWLSSSLFSRMRLTLFLIVQNSLFLVKRSMKTIDFWNWGATRKVKTAEVLSVKVSYINLMMVWC